jgi:hypothetical protein
MLKLTNKLKIDKKYVTISLWLMKLMAIFQAETNIENWPEKVERNH